MTMPGKPPDFEPLASTDPVPGDPASVAQLGRRYGNTAYEIQQQAANLRKLATSATQGWIGKSGTVFASKAQDLATRISRAHDRYAAAGQALTRSATPMDDAQQRAYAAVWKAKQAQQQMTANAPPIPGTASTTPGPDPAQQARTIRYGEAENDMAAARRQFSAAVGDYTTAVNTAARAISKELGSDPLKDSWWDANFGWISNVFKWVGVAVMALAVIALILAIPPVGAALAGILGAGLMGGITATATGLLVTLTVSQTIFDGFAMGTGKESWVPFGMDIVALATLGTGKAAEAGMKWLAENAATIGKEVGAARAGQDAFRARRLPGILYSVAIRSGLAAGALRLLGAAPALDAASEAAEKAGSAVTTAVEAADPTIRLALGTMSKDMSQDFAKIKAVEAMVPNVWRITAAQSAAKAMAGVDGALQWGAFGGSGYFTWHALTAPGA
jgi:uncharacterized protein YukE